MKILTHSTSTLIHREAARSLSSQVDLASKAERLAGVTSRDLFVGADPHARGQSLIGRGRAPSPQTVPALPGAPAVPGRSRVSELNPFDAQALPSRGGGNVEADMEAGMSRGTTVPMGLDRDARRAGILAEADASVGNATGPEAQPGAVGDWDLGKIGDAAIEGAVAGGIVGGIAGGIMAGPPGALRGAVDGAWKTGLSKAVGETVRQGVGEFRAKRAEAKKSEEEKKAEDKKADEKKAEDKKADEKKADDGKSGTEKTAPDKGDESKKGDVGPGHHGDGRSYERNMEVYFGAARGTPFGLRDSGSAASSAADPRKTNPGRGDDEQEGPAEDAVLPSIHELTLSPDPDRGRRADARAAALLQTSRISGRVILTDSSAGDDHAAPKTPRGNGLV